MRLTWFVVPLLMLAGCDDFFFGPEFPLDSGGGVGGDPQFTPDWDGIQAFTAERCEGCHPALSEPDFPSDLESDITDGTGRYVVPGEPENSVFWTVLTGDADGIPLMPQGNPEPLPDAVIGHVEEWILDGASLD